jgi:hypothetical protein
LLSGTNLGHNPVASTVERFLSAITPGESGTDDEQRRRVDLRTALLGAGALAAGYLLGRSLRSSNRPSTGALRERAGAALPGDGVEVPIVGSDEADAGAAGTDPTLEEVDERTGRDVGQVPEREIDKEDTGASAEGGIDEGVEEEIEERAEDDIQEEPAEPGEMHVDEDLAEEVLDEEDEE